MNFNIEKCRSVEIVQSHKDIILFEKKKKFHEISNNKLRYFETFWEIFEYFVMFSNFYRYFLHIFKQNYEFWGIFEYVQLLKKMFEIKNISSYSSVNDHIGDSGKRCRNKRCGDMRTAIKDLIIKGFLEYYLATVKKSRHVGIS